MRAVERKGVEPRRRRRGAMLTVGLGFVLLLALVQGVTSAAAGTLATLRTDRTPSHAQGSLRRKHRSRPLDFRRGPRRPGPPPRRPPRNGWPRAGLPRRHLLLARRDGDRLRRRSRARKVGHPRDLPDRRRRHEPPPPSRSPGRPRPAFLAGRHHARLLALEVPQPEDRPGKAPADPRQGLCEHHHLAPRPRHGEGPPSHSLAQRPRHRSRLLLARRRHPRPHPQR
jgi:hypothetical protein